MTGEAHDSGLRCLACDYNLTGVPGDRCPECGWQIDAELADAAARADRTSVRWLVVVFCVAAVVAAGVAVHFLAPLGDNRLAARTYQGVTLAACVGLLMIGAAAVPVLRLVPRWPMRSRGRARTCMVLAGVQIIVAGAYTLDQRIQVVRSLVDFLVLFAITSAPGGCLAVAALVAFTTRGEQERHLRVRVKREAGLASKPPPFEILHMGRFKEGDVQAVAVDAPRASNRALDEIIAETWDQKLAEAKQRNQILFNGSLARLISHEVRDGVLKLTVGPTNYRDFVGTNLYNRRLWDELGDDCFANPVGTTATVITRDGFLLYGRRNHRVAFHGGYLHTFGGALEDADRTPAASGCPAGGYDVFASLRRELREELHLSDEEIADVICTGLARDTSIMQPELLFDAYVTVTRDQLRQRHPISGSVHGDGTTGEPGTGHQREDAPTSTTQCEHSGIEACHDDPESIVPFVASSEPIAPVAIAALMLHGADQWGHEWFENTAYLLFGNPC